MKISIITTLIDKDLESFNRIISSAEALKDYEIIAVLDGMTKIDDMSRLTCYSDSNKDKIKFIFNGKLLGVFESRRKGLDAASGDNVWFVDATDFIVCNLADEQVYNDYDIVVHDKEIMFEGSNFASIRPQKNLDISLNDYKKLNPITNKYITQMYMNNSIGTFIFKKDFIKKVYDKLPEIKKMNKFASLYLSTAALCNMKSLKYVSKCIYTYTYKTTYYIDSNAESHNEFLNMHYVNTKEMFNSKDVKKFLKLIPDDPNDKFKIKELVTDYINGVLEDKPKDE